MIINGDVHGGTAVCTVPEFWGAIRQPFTHFAPDEFHDGLATGYDNNLAVEAGWAGS